MSGPVALKGHHHICPAVDGTTPHVGGPIVHCQQSFVTYNGIPVALVGDKLLCKGTNTLDTIVTGSSCVKINGIPVARLGDLTAHGGVIVEGKEEFKID